MYEMTVWIDVALRTPDRTEPLWDILCTLFGRVKFVTKPSIDEALSFHPSKDSNYSFHLVSPIGHHFPSNSVRVNVEGVTHCPLRKDGTSYDHTSLHCSEVVVPSKEDAKQLCRFLIAEYGFEIDRYGLNELGEVD
jgi:hypothetical protein